MEKEEAITRSKDRHYFMKQTVSSRNNFSAAHSSYAASLKNAGAALIDFAQGEQQNFQLSPSYDVPLPPPPLPDLPPALRRAITMPDFEFVETGLEEVADDDDVDEEIVERCGLSRREKRSVSMNMIQVLSEVDNHFIMASESAREVSVILQATRLHYHSNFSNTTGGNHESANLFLCIFFKLFSNIIRVFGVRYMSITDTAQTETQVIEFNFLIFIFQDKIYSITEPECSGNCEMRSWYNKVSFRCNGERLTCKIRTTSKF